MPAGQPADPKRVVLDAVAPLASFETRAEAAALYDLAGGRRVLEVGTYLGFSAILMALAGAQYVDTVDPHLGGPLLPVQDTLAAAWANVRSYGVQDTVRLHVGAAEAVLPFLHEGSWDLAFIDGDHQAAVHDVVMVRQLLAHPHVIALHDAGRWSQVDEAIEYLERAGYLLQPPLDSLVIASSA